MTSSRKDPTLSNDDSRDTFFDAPWPSWPYINTPGRTLNINLSNECPPEFIPLAREFNNLIYMSQLEVRPSTLKNYMDACRFFLVFLSVLDAEARPSSVSGISGNLLQRFENFMNSPESNKLNARRRDSNSARHVVGIVRSVLRRGWRAGHFSGAAPIDLGRSPRRRQPKEGKVATDIYSESEFRRIKIAVAEKRKQPRGESLNEERSYLAACCCVLFIYTPANAAGVCSLKMDALQRGETDQKYDVLTILKFRPIPTAHRTPVEKYPNSDSSGKFLDLQRGRSQIRRIFTENSEFNSTRKVPNSLKTFLFVCRYTGPGGWKGNVFDVFDKAALKIGLRCIEDQFGLVDDNGKPLRISPRKLRATYENSLPKTETLKDNADAMGHADLETTASYYEVVTDNDHRRFQIGLGAIGAAISGLPATAIATRSGSVLSAEVIERLRAGFQTTFVASCTDPLKGEHAPKDDSKCNKTLTCFFCFNMAVVTSDLYRLASLERRITIDVESGRLQGDSRATLLTIRSIISDDIFQCFEIRHVRTARKQAENRLHPLWARPFDTTESKQS